MTIKNKKFMLNKIVVVLATIFFIFLSIIVGAYFIFEKKYSNKIYPGIFIAGINMQGKTNKQAEKILNNKIDNISQTGIPFYYDYFQATLFPLVSSVESDLTYQIIDFNIEESINQAIRIGRGKNFLKNLTEKISILINKKNISIINKINKTEVEKFLQNNFSKFETPAQDAKLEFNKKKFKIIKEIYGQVIDFKKAIKKLETNLTYLDPSSIKLLAKIEHPKIYKKDCLNIESKAKKIINKKQIILNYETKEWIINKEELISWLLLKKENDKIEVAINNELIIKFFNDNIASTTEKKPIDAKFKIENEKVVEFQASKDGIELDTQKNIENIKKYLYNFNQDDNNIKIITKKIKSKFTTEKINNIGIKEIIGTGHSNFSGSPSNRRHNITNGSDTLNGLIVKPNEEFSLIKTLGEINAETGYLPELVIKDNKTILEFGGGLCQVGTTLFRTVVASGLPVTARRSHSYRVSYYEPAGTDATIYDPWPDFKFINDTPNNILIQTRIEKDELYYDFWGTKDGRIATATYPVIYNIKRPAATKYIETLDLAVGKKRCTEHAHNGADAYFDYKVIYPKKENEEESEIKETRFKSHYVPWRAVCLIGVEKLSTTTDEIK